MARARIRRNPFLLGKRLANAGLIISYSVLVCSLVYVASKTYQGAQRTTIIRKEADELAVMTARGVDQVRIGDPDSEAEHGLHGNSETGVFFGRRWRGSTGGHFSYLMKVLPTRPMNLNCRYWGSDTGARKFDILVNEKIIATETLDRNVPERFFDVEYKIPQNLTRGRNEVTVEFRAHQGNGAGGVFGCQMLRR
jgi:hypothetical protein